MKSWIQFVLVFAFGLGLGAFAHKKMAAPLEKPSVEQCRNAQGEEKVTCEMVRFQAELDSMGAPKSADELSKQVEAQGGILELITKFHESEFAKYTPFSGLVGVFLGGILGFFLPMLGRKRSSGISPDA